MEFPFYEGEASAGGVGDPPGADQKGVGVRGDPDYPEGLSENPPFIPTDRESQATFGRPCPYKKQKKHSPFGK